MKKINEIFDNNTYNNQKSTPYDNLTKVYKIYVQKSNKSDFANSPNRYIVEIGLVQEIQKKAKKQNLDTSEWIKKEQELRNKLKKEWKMEIGD